MASVSLHKLFWSQLKEILICKLNKSWFLPVIFCSSLLPLVFPSHSDSWTSFCLVYIVSSPWVWAELAFLASLVPGEESPFLSGHTICVMASDERFAREPSLFSAPKLISWLGNVHLQFCPSIKPTPRPCPHRPGGPIPLIFSFFTVKPLLDQERELCPP